MVGSHGFARCGGHSLAQQTSSSVPSCSPVFAFQAVCVFARCKEAAELCSCCVPNHGEGTAGTSSMEVSCPLLCHLPITPCVGQCWWGQQPCCWGLLCASCSRWSWLVVTAEERREKMSAVMCCGAWQCCGTQHTREPQTACGTLLLSGCSGALRCSHHQDPPGNLSFVSPVGFPWLVPVQSPGSFSWCAAKRGCGGRMGQSRQVHGQVYSTWLSVNEIRRDQEQQTPGGRWW